MTAENKTVASTPSQLSYQRTLLVSDAQLFNYHEQQFGNGEQPTDERSRYRLSPLNVIRTGMRGTQNTNKPDQKDVANIQTFDEARKSADSDGYAVRYHVAILPVERALSSTNDFTYRQKNSAFVKKALNSQGLSHVVSRIARKITSADALWRNRMEATSVKVVVAKCGSNQELGSCEALDLNPNDFSEFTDFERKIADCLLKGAKNMGSEDSALEVTMYVKGLPGATQVYPSQAFMADKPTGFSRALYTHGDAERYDPRDPSATRIMGQAAMTDRKIANRLRAIDTWYTDYPKYGVAIPVEPNGANLDIYAALRTDEKSAFNIFASIDQVDPNSEAGMFALGIMLRGAVLSGKSEDKEAKADGAAKAKKNSKKSTTQESVIAE